MFNTKLLGLPFVSLLPLRVLFSCDMGHETFSSYNLIAHDLDDLILRVGNLMAWWYEKSTALSEWIHGLSSMELYGALSC